MGKMLFIVMLLTEAVLLSYGCTKDDFDDVNEPIVIDSIDEPIIGGTYYVSPDGSDSDPGTFEKPWATLQKAFDNAKAGDTVYFRGGVYYMDKGAILDPTYLYWQYRFGNNGTAKGRICYFNYPGETPIFDGTHAQDRDGYLTAIGIECAHFISFRGFEIRNFSQRGNNWWVGGIGCQLCSNLRFENIKIHDMGGRAFFYLSAVGDRRGYDYLPAGAPEPVTFWRYWDEKYPVYIPYDSTYFINCDAYNCADVVAVQAGGTPYNMADGFKLAQTAGGYIHVEGCRAWNVSDDGFDMNGSALGVFKNCWSFENGINYSGALDGNGFKYGFVDKYDYSDVGNTYVTRIMTNNIAAYNARNGFMEGVLAWATMEVNYNTAYKNDVGFIQGINGAVGAYLKNSYNYNISFDNNRNSLMAKWVGSNNTWKYCESCMNWASENISLTKDDFISLDVKELKRPRKDDGSLPDVNFLKLKPGNNLKIGY